MFKDLDRKSLLLGVLLGGASFVAISYVCHCRFGLGPWKCQRGDPRRLDS
jgi:hypothetical protein